MSTVARVVGIDEVSQSDLRSLADAASTLGVNVDWLATVVSFETGGTFSPSVANRHSGAFGLIQFLPSTAARMLKTTKDEAVRVGTAMSFSEQMKRLVIPYFKSFGVKFKSLDDLYLAVFYPAAMNKPDEYIVGYAGGAVYDQNSGFDRDGKGYITRGDILRRIRAHGRATDRIPVPGGGWIQVVAGIAVAAAGLYGLYRVQPHLPPRWRLSTGVRHDLKGVFQWPEEKIADTLQSLPSQLSELSRSGG